MSRNGASALRVASTPEAFPSDVSRRLAAVAFADVAGYSRLMGIDDMRTLALWGKLRREVMAPAMEVHGGRLAQMSGDAVLVEFSSAVSALSWAIDVQRNLRSQSSDGDRSNLELRIGVNVDDIIEYEGTLQSDGVNIAARIHQAAEPGDIVLTGIVRELVENRLPISFRDLGMPPLKNIRRPVHVFAVDLDAGAPSAPVVQPHLVWSSRPTLAVLPFRNRSGREDDRYFGEGMTEDIIAGLSRSRTLFVIARTSTLRLQDAEDDPHKIGTRLGVKYILNGSVRRQSDRLRINAELIEVEHMRSMWAEHYDGEAGELFEFQDRIVSSIVASLEPNVRAAEMARLGNRPTESLDAYDCVLKVISRLYEFTEDSYAETEQLLRRAVRLDPSYAQAHAYLAWRLNFWIGEGHSRDLARDRAAALSASRKAVALDPGDSFALVVRGHLVSFLEGKPDEALEFLEEALRLDRNSPLAWALTSVTYAYLGNGDEARERLRNVWRLAPFDPLNFFFWIIAGIAEFVAGRYEEALVWMSKSNRANPPFVATLRMLAATQALAGNEEEARATAQELLRIEPEFRVSSFVKWYPLRREEDKAKLAEGLRIAGLPE